MKEVTDAAFAKVFEDHAAGKLKWRRAGEDLEKEFHADVVVKNGRGEEISIIAILYTTSHVECLQEGYLVLGGRGNAPSLYTGDKRVIALFEQLTGTTWSNRV